MGLYGGAMGSQRVRHDWAASLSFFLQSFVHKALHSVNTREMVLSLGQEDPLEEEMTNHSNILAWKIQWTRGAWQATVYGVTKSSTQLSYWHTHTFTDYYSVALELWNLCGPRGFWPSIWSTCRNSAPCWSRNGISYSASHGWDSWCLVFERTPYNPTF